ncbi:hypothetical protein E1281_22335 [Actinomadura sp. KC345]|uniref:hypothetical protein n=1 Tax=Actinomadura sp. KC345 TaxID=2530371 RepID=UPI001047936A|nr:hypothetical protein [Actinomadura sp. KC345]TDC50226.1 hypothetical protein E1281_22335 [Actinomadura sp. KC345]
MRSTEDLPTNLASEWLAQYRDLLDHAPQLAERLRARPEEEFVLVPVPRPLFDRLRPGVLEAAARRTGSRSATESKRRRTLPVADITGRP